MQAHYKNGRKVRKGAEVKDFRGQLWTFLRVSRDAVGCSDGRVLVVDEFGREREFFPSVFDLRIK